MSIALASRGMYGGGGNADTTPPVVSVVSTPTTSVDPMVFHIYDETGLAFYHVTCRDTTDGPRLTIYDPIDAGFSHPFGGKSTLTGTGTSVDPYIFTVYRRGGWPTNLNLDIRARAVDTGGNEVHS